MDVLKGQVKAAIVEAVNSDLDRYFLYESFQTDVADYYFRLDDVRRYDDEIETEINGNYVLIKIGWADATLDYNLDFKLTDVEADLYQYDEEGNETITGFSFKEI